MTEKFNNNVFTRVLIASSALFVMVFSVTPTAMAVPADDDDNNKKQDVQRIVLTKEEQEQYHACVELEKELSDKCLLKLRAKVLYGYQQKILKQKQEMIKQLQKSKANAYQSRNRERTKEGQYRQP